MKFEDGVVVGAVVVTAEGRVDASNAALFDAHCRQAMTGHNRVSLILDLESVEYMSSAGLRAVLSLGKHAKSLGGSLVLCGLKGAVREIFDIAGFLGLFPIAETLEKAAGIVAAGARKP
jgi:anti-anti-sigma factor